MWTQQPTEKYENMRLSVDDNLLLVVGAVVYSPCRVKCCFLVLAITVSRPFSSPAVLFLAISVVSPLLKTVNRDCFQIPVVHDTQRLASTWSREWDGRRSFAYCGLCLLHCLCALFAFFFITLEPRERQFICVVEKEWKIFLTFARASSSRYGDFNV